MWAVTGRLSENFHKINATSQSKYTGFGARPHTCQNAHRLSRQFVIDVLFLTFLGLKLSEVDAGVDE